MVWNNVIVFWTFIFDWKSFICFKLVVFIWIVPNLFIPFIETFWWWGQFFFLCVFYKDIVVLCKHFLNSLTLFQGTEFRILADLCPTFLHRAFSVPRWVTFTIKIRTFSISFNFWFLRWISVVCLYNLLSPLCFYLIIWASDLPWIRWKEMCVFPP